MRKLSDYKETYCMRAGSNVCKLGVVVSPQGARSDPAQCASPHKHTKRRGVRSTAPAHCPQCLLLWTILKRVLWVVSKVCPSVLAAGEGECFTVPERKAVWEVCIFVCLSARLSVPLAARRGRPSV